MPAYVSYAGASRTLGSDPPVPVPAGGQDGDLLVCVINTSGASAVTSPAGWNVHASSLDAGNPLCWRIANSEPASYTWVTPGVVNSIGVMVRISDAKVTDPLPSVAGILTTTSTTIAIPSVTGAQSNSLLLSVVSRNAAPPAPTPPGSMTQRYNDVFANQNYRGAGATEEIGAGATGTRTWTIQGNPHLGYNMAINPAGIAYSQSPSDSATASEAIIKSAGKVITDGAAPSDSFSRVLQAFRTQTDAIAAADAIAKSVGLTLADSIAVANSVSLMLGKSLSDPLTTSDAFSRVSSYARQFGDSVVPSDALGKHLGLVFHDEVGAAASPSTGRRIIVLSD